MKTLKLFNAVLAKEVGENKPFLSDDGFIIEPDALWAQEEILEYYLNELLDGNDLNKTFRNSWSIIKESPKYDLINEQVRHYISTYGSDFKDEMYIPNNVLAIPEITLSYKIIKGHSKGTLTRKCLDLLTSGIALTEETIDDVIDVLVNTLDYEFTGDEGIKNKEAIIKIADMFGIFPKDIIEFFRCIIFKSTGSTLLIKNKETVGKIITSDFNPGEKFEAFGLEKLAEIFNRFKPLFLAYKGKCPNVINKISKLSKKNHKPMIENPLNHVTSKALRSGDLHWLVNATPFALFKALSACYSRMNGQDTFAYRIRNGKSYVKEGKTYNCVEYNYHFILKHLKERFNFEGISIFLPKDIKYALPTSEKMFIGNIPTGTRFYGEKLAAGIYWENDWGAHDFDLSGINVGGKVGWNSQYNQGDGNLMYSGDITNAPDGATEYLYANTGLAEPTLVLNNIFSGDEGAGLKIIIGKGGDIDRDYMMDPNNLMLDVKTKAVERQTIIGLMTPKKDKQCFTLLNFGAGSVNVSYGGVVTDLYTKGLYQQWAKPLTFKKVMKELGVKFVDKVEDAHYNLSLGSLEKDSFTKPFEEIKDRILV